MTVRIAVCGAAGRMGRALIEAVTNADSLTLGAAIEHPGSSVIGVDAVWWRVTSPTVAYDRVRSRKVAYDG